MNWLERLNCDKCDEHRPACYNCVRSSRECEGYPVLISDMRPGSERSPAPLGRPRATSNTGGGGRSSEPVNRAAQTMTQTPSVPSNTRLTSPGTSVPQQSSNQFIHYNAHTLKPPTLHSSLTCIRYRRYPQEASQLPQCGFLRSVIPR